jgi:uncharacterized protein YggU (UPF0235/DUF167 family)
VGEHLFALAAGTKSAYEVAIRLRILPEFGRRKLDAITPGDVRRFLDRLSREGVGDASVRKTADVLQSIFKRAELNEFVSRNPVKPVKKRKQRPKRKPEIVDPPKIEEVRAAVPVDGRANVALCQLLAKRLSVGSRAVTVTPGVSSRDKLVQIDGLSARQVRDVLGLPAPKR